MTDGLAGRVAAVIVTYNPPDALREACAALLPQVDQIVVVDNGSAPPRLVFLRDLAAAAGDRLTLICNPDNQGLARAQNRGIEVALERGADWVLLMDDDSRPAETMMAAFARAYAALAAAGGAERIAILAANLDAGDGTAPTKYLIGDHRWRWRPRPIADAMAEPAIYSFSSGSLIRRDALLRIGPMREDFFIDYIDVEYGLRANSLGYRVMVVRDARLFHHHGDPRRHRLLGRTVTTTNHPPGRRFTITRNRARVWLSYAGRWPGWFLFDLTAAAAELVYVVAFEDAKLAKLRSMAAGMWTGMRLGRL